MMKKNQLSYHYSGSFKKKKFQHIKKFHKKTNRTLLIKSYVFFQFSLNPIIEFELTQFSFIIWSKKGLFRIISTFII
jgi:hypothetical protein